MNVVYFAGLWYMKLRVKMSEGFCWPLVYIKLRLNIYMLICSAGLGLIQNS